jgi:hypothetical protein
MHAGSYNASCLLLCNVDLFLAAIYHNKIYSSDISKEPCPQSLDCLAILAASSLANYVVTLGIFL